MLGACSPEGQSVNETGFADLGRPEHGQKRKPFSAREYIETTTGQIRVCGKYFEILVTAVVLLYLPGRAGVEVRGRCRCAAELPSRAKFCLLEVLRSLRQSLVTIFRRRDLEIKRTVSHQTSGMSKSRCLSLYPPSLERIQITNFL